MFRSVHKPDGLVVSVVARRGVLGLTAVASAGFALLAPISASATQEGVAQAGTVEVVDNVVIKTPVVPQKPFIPEGLTWEAGCHVSVSGSCVPNLGTASTADVKLNDQWACAENPDTSCDYQNPHTAGCDGDASVAADDWYTNYNNHTYYLAERWSGKCQSNWALWEDTTQASYLDAQVGYGANNEDINTDVYPGGYVTEVYSLMLYGGRGEPCVQAVGNFQVGQWTYWLPRCV